MTALTIPETVLPSAVLLSDEGMSALDDLTHRSGIITTIPDGDEDAFKLADQVCRDLATMKSSIEKQRKALKEPALTFGRQLDAIAEQASSPLDRELVRLGPMVKGWQIRENARRAKLAEDARKEAERLQREAEKAQRDEAERVRRLQEEERQKQIAEAQALAAEHAAPGEEPAPVEVPELPPEPVFVAQPTRVLVAPTPPPVTSSIRTKIDHVVVVVNDAEVPCTFQGATLRPIDLALAKGLMKRGMKIPGLRLDEIGGTASTGR